MTKATQTRAKETGLTSAKIMAMTDAGRANLIAEIEAETPEQRLARSRPLNARQRAAWGRVKKKMGRPVVGKGAKMVMLTIERGLLEEADEFARAKGLKRSELFAASIRQALRDGLKAG